MVVLQHTYQINFGNGYFGTTAVSSAQNPDDGKVFLNTMFQQVIEHYVLNQLNARSIVNGTNR